MTTRVGAARPRCRPTTARLAIVVAAVAAACGSGVAVAEPAPAGDLVVGFQPQTARARQRSLDDLGLDVVRAVPHLDLVRVRPRRGDVDPAAVLAHPAVTSVHEVGRFRSTAAVAAPNDPGFARQWNLPLIQVPQAWSVSRGKGAVVAVLDTGVAYEDYGRFKRAPDLAGTTFVPGHDFVENDDHPNDDIDEAAAHRPAHGTHSAGIIAQTTDNGVGSAGLAPEASIMPIRVLGFGGEGTDDQIAAGIVFAADHGAHVINMSFDSPLDRPMTKAAVAHAAAKGVTMVAATGNTGRGVVGFPAAYPEVLAVGAVRFDKTRPPYSAFGALGDVDLVAPGGDLSVDQNGDGAPDGIVSQSMVYATNGFGELPVEGTSAAAPHVSAVAAMLIGSGLATTPAAVKKALQDSALDVGAPGPDPLHGAGLVQARAALTAAGAPPPGPDEAPATPSPTVTTATTAPPSGPGTVAAPTTDAADRAGTSWGLAATLGAVVVAAAAALVLLLRKSR